MQQSLAPSVLFVYNRRFHTEKTVAALQLNELAVHSDLFIYSDGAKNSNDSGDVQNVRDYLKTVQGFKSVTIVEKKENAGLANSIVSGVTEVIRKHGKIIVIEDDLVTSPYFLSYMNQGLDFYEKEERVASIHGYVYPSEKELPHTFFIRGADCWGWATWKRAWDLFEPDGKKLLSELHSQKLEKEFNFDNSFDYIGMLERQISGQNNSWAIRWYASAFLRNMLTLYPGQTLVRNIGFDGSGTHSKGDGGKIFESELSFRSIELKPIEIEESEVGREAFVRYFETNKSKKNKPQGILSAIKQYLKKNSRIRASVIQTRAVLEYLFSNDDDPLRSEKPWIVAAAIDFLEGYLKKNMEIFEWGGGGSTFFLARKVKYVISVEHHYAWFLKMKVFLKLRRISNCDLTLIEPEKSSAELMYKSTDKSYLTHSFEKYCKAIDVYPDDYFDLIFIDGRARASCIMHGKNKVKIGGYILLDNSDREEYSSGILLLSQFRRTDFTDSNSRTSIFQRLL